MYKDTIPRVKRTFTVSFPIPVLLPVTMITFPDRSGMSSTVKWGLGMKTLCFMRALAVCPILYVLERSTGREGHEEIHDRQCETYSIWTRR